MKIENLGKKIIRAIRHPGYALLVTKNLAKKAFTPPDPPYHKWIKKIESKEILNHSLISPSKISIILDSSDNSTLDSIKSQSYENYEIIDEISAATGDYLLFMSPGDRLPTNCLLNFAIEIEKNDRPDLIYSDHDYINLKGERHSPFFKPDYSPDTLLSFNYIGNSILFNIDLINSMGKFTCRYDLILKATKAAGSIFHIPKILYTKMDSQENIPTEIKDLENKARINHLKSLNINATLEEVNYKFNIYVSSSVPSRPVYIPRENTLVSIIIPSKDNPGILENCLNSLITLTEFKNYELIVVDNGSSTENRDRVETLCKSKDARYIYEPMEFNFAKMCNMGARASMGDLLLFLNDDIEIIEGCCLSRMAGAAQLPHVGAVGAKLYYPGGKLIQHDGVAALYNGPDHLLKQLKDEGNHYFYRNILDYNYLAVTGACLMIERDKFNSVGGFNENFPVAYNDVDLCYNLIEKGYYNLLRNDARLIHHESLSRGNDLADQDKYNRLMAEQKKLYKLHPAFDKKDPFYNINLSQTKLDFSIDYRRKIT